MVQDLLDLVFAHRTVLDDVVVEIAQGTVLHHVSVDAPQADFLVVHHDVLVVQVADNTRLTMNVVPN